jgi:hypothetical protein
LALGGICEPEADRAARDLRWERRADVFVCLIARSIALRCLGNSVNQNTVVNERFGVLSRRGWSLGAALILRQPAKRLWVSHNSFWRHDGLVRWRPARRSTRIPAWSGEDGSCLGFVILAIFLFIFLDLKQTLRS